MAQMAWTVFTSFPFRRIGWFTKLEYFLMMRLIVCSIANFFWSSFRCSTIVVPRCSVDDLVISYSPIPFDDQQYVASSVAEWEYTSTSSATMNAA